MLNYGEIWLFPKHTRIIRQLLFWWLQAQAKHIGVTSFAIGWAVLEIWTTCLPNCAKSTVKFGYFLNTLESSGQLLFWWLQAQGKHIGVTSFAIGWAVLEIWNTCLPNWATSLVKFGYFQNTLESLGNCFSDDCKHKPNMCWTSFAIGWAILEIWTTWLPNCATSIRK